MALNEKAVKELLHRLVFTHPFHNFEAREEAQGLLTELDTAHNDETVAAEEAKAAQAEQAASDAKDAEFADRVRRYNEAHTPVTPVTPEGGQ